MAGPAVIMPYLMSMLLGRTIDLRTYDIGPTIYDYSNYTEVSATNLNATYHVVQGTSFPYAFFYMPVDVVLRIKANFLSSSSGAMGLDGLLKDSSWKRDSVVVPFAVVYSTVERSLRPEAQPLDGWKRRTSKTHTHYASKLLLGGWFVTLYRFRCGVPSDVPLVRRLLTGVLGTHGQLGDKTVELWKKALETVQSAPDVRGPVTVDAYFYSSVSLPSPVDSSDIKQLLKAKDDLMKVVGSVGEPMYMTLKPLNDIDSKFAKVNRSDDSIKELSKFDECFDDVKNARNSLVRWIQDTDQLFDDDQEERIYRLLQAMNTCLREFHAVVASLSLYKPLDSFALTSALNTYLKGLGRGDGSYEVAFRRLKEEIDAQCESEFFSGVKGLLKVFSDEGSQEPKEVGAGGLEDCKALCLKEARCRSIGYADHVSVLDLRTGNYLAKKNQCWIFYRSTSTTVVGSPTEYSGDLKVYDRKCY